MSMLFLIGVMLSFVTVFTHWSDTFFCCIDIRRRYKKKRIINIISNISAITSMILLLVSSLLYRSFL